MTEDNIVTGRDLTYAFFVVGFGCSEKLKFVLQMQGSQPDFYNKCVTATLDFHRKQANRIAAHHASSESQPSNIALIRQSQKHFLKLLKAGPEKAFYVDHVHEYIREATNWYQ